MRLKVNGEFMVVEEVVHGTILPTLIMEDGTEWYIAENQGEAGEKAREYWEDVVQNDPNEFACLVGDENLIQWAMGHPAGPGSNKESRSLDEWLDLISDTPEEHFASWDGLEVDVEIVSRDLYEELGFSYDPGYDCEVVMYRHN